MRFMTDYLMLVIYKSKAKHSARKHALNSQEGQTKNKMSGMQVQTETRNKRKKIAMSHRLCTHTKRT